MKPDGQGCVLVEMLKALLKVGGRLARLARFADLTDQVEAAGGCHSDG